MAPFRVIAALLVGLLGVAGLVQAGEGQAGHYCTIGQGVGLGGYDPVSYFPEGGSKPMKGFVLRSFEYDGVTYRFASDANLESFKKAPTKYLPVYGGWCAWAVAKLGKKVDVDPESFLVRNGKLYLFYNHHELNTRADWLAREAEFGPKAEANWASLSR